MTILESLKEKVLEKFPNQTLYPNKTKDLLSYCNKNVELMLEAYEQDLAEGSDRHTNMMISQHYYGNRRQTKNIDLEVELWLQTELVSMLSENKNNVEKAFIATLFDKWKDVFEGETHETSQSFLENLTMNRASFSFFDENFKVDAVKTEKILAAANGITPSLGNNFHYRVDVLPQETKDAMAPFMHSFYPDATDETKKLFEENPHAHTKAEWTKLGVCHNHQFDAPLVLAYSMPVPDDGSYAHWTTEQFETSKDATFVALGLNMWNTICAAEEMGLNSCCLKAYNKKALTTFKTKTSAEMPEGWNWEPFIFLCIGKGLEAKGDHRKYKPRGIVNTLEFEVAA